MSKRILALVLSLAMLLGLSVMASAADTSIYSVKVQDNSVIFLKDGKTVATYAAKDTDIRVMTDDEGDTLVCFYDKQGNYQGISVGTQKTLTIDGTMNTLSLYSTLASDVKVTIPTTAKIENLIINSSSSVTISGKVDEMKVTGAATIAATKSSSIGDYTLNSKAKMTVSTGADVEIKNSTAKKTSGTTSREVVGNLRGASGDGLTDREVVGNLRGSSGDGTTSKTKVGTLKPVDDDDDWDSDEYGDIDDVISIKLDIDGPLYASEGDELRDLLSDLDSSVTAYYRDSDGEEHDVNGTVKWKKSGSTEVKDGKSYSFTFEPRSSKFSSRSGSIKIEVD